MGTYRYLIFNLFSRMGMLFMFSFILSQMKATKNLVYRKPDSLKDRLILSVIFGAFGILGTYLSIEFNGALINTRVIGIAAGGILGGPIVGLLGGIIAGIHRYFIPSGEFTQLACAVSVPLEGLLAGYIGLKIKGKKHLWIYAFFVGAICESLRKISVLVFSRPFPQAVELVKDIWLPMVLINSLGMAFLFILIGNVTRERERAGAEQVNLSISIIDRILPYIKGELDPDNSSKVTQIIYDMSDFDAVAITDTEKVLAYSGMESKELLRVGQSITNYTRTVIDSKEMQIIDKNVDDEVFFKYSIIVPIKKLDDVIGTMKFYKHKSYILSPIDVKVAYGLSKLYATQIKVVELEKQSQLLVHSELKALQAQINPHFLFNALMIIASLCRTDSIKARELVLHLGNYFRKNISGGKQLINLSEEINHIKSYVAIEKARFDDKLEVNYHIDETVDLQLPPLTLQPLVENAIKHGILKKKEGGVVNIQVTQSTEKITIKIEDNGIGIPQDRVGELLNHDRKTNSIGINNVNQRLMNIFGLQYQMSIESEVGLGTRVVMEMMK